MGYKREILEISKIKIRRCWDDEEEERRYSVVDVIYYIIRSKDSVRYYLNMKKRKEVYYGKWKEFIKKIQLKTDTGKFMITTLNLAGLYQLFKAIPKKYDGRKRRFKLFVE